MPARPEGTVCAECRYKHKPDPNESSRCLAPEVRPDPSPTAWVTGDFDADAPRCYYINTEGKCPHFEAKAKKAKEQIITWRSPSGSLWGATIAADDTLTT